MISNRLKSLVKYIKKSDKVIDIGCDHALLDIYLVKNGFLNKMIVSDIHKNALQCGIDNIKKEGLLDKIDTRLGSGLEVLNNKDDINTVLISGMGTSTILKILDNDYRKKIDKLIIQSNNDYYLLRKYITELGYIITHEESIYDNSKYYVNIVFEKGNSEYSEEDLKYGPILKSDKDYYKYLKEKYEDILKSIPNESNGKKEILDKIKELDKLI